MNFQVKRIFYFDFEYFFRIFLVIKLSLSNRYMLMPDNLEYILNRRPNAMYRDCFFIGETKLDGVLSNTDEIDDYVLLCIRIPYDEKVNENPTKCSDFTKQKITFEKLYNESTNDFLLFASENKIFFQIEMKIGLLV